MFILLILFSMLSYADTYVLEDIIYSTKMNKKEDESLQNVVVLNSEKIKQFRNIEDALRSIPSFSIKRSGGGVGSFSYRGLPSRYSLILVDGMRMSDFSSINNTYNLSDLNIANVERIEVLTGAHSVLYGQGANASVINIITKKYNKDLTLIKGNRFVSRLNSYMTYGESLGFVRGYHERDNSLSAVENGKEEDLRVARGVTLGFERENFKLFATKENFFNEFDDFDTKPKDLVGNYSKTDTERLNLEVSFKKLKLSSEYSKIVTNRVDTFGDSSFESNSLLNSLEFIKKNTIIGVSHEYQNGITKSIDEKRNIYSLYGLFEKKVNGFDLYLGLRAEDIEDAGNYEAYSLGGSYNLSKFSKLSFNTSLGNRLPSFYQLYDTSFNLNNENLNVEKSEVYELVYQYKGNLKLSLFYNKINDVIIVKDNKYINSSVLENSGFEGSFKSKNIELGVTLIDNKSDLPIPSEQYFLSFLKQMKVFSYSLRADYFSSREENNKKLSDYTLIQANFSKSWRKFDFSLNIYNLLNQSYQESFGYERPGRTFELLGKFNF